MRIYLLAALVAIACFVFAPPVRAADGTAAQRKAAAVQQPCPVTGKPTVTCAGYVIAWDRPACMPGARLQRTNESATVQKHRSADFAARCAAHKAEYDACIAKPLLSVCTTRGCGPKWRDCAAIVLGAP